MSLNTDAASGGAESIENLAVAVHRGSDGALERLYELFERPLHRYAYGILQNTADAQEVVQDAMLRAHRALTHRYDEARCETLSLRPWLFRTVRNLCLNRRRSKMRAAEQPLSAIGDARLEPFVNAHDADLEREEDVAALRLAIDTLPLAARELIILRFIEELPYAEIAKTVGAGEAALRGKIFRALRQLRSALNDQGTRHAMHIS
jgi:RNA polymerase sigma-70 factor, ECF subfamily